MIPVAVAAVVSLLLGGCTDISQGVQAAPRPAVEVGATAQTTAKTAKPAGIQLISPDDTTAPPADRPTEYSMPDTDALHSRIDEIRLANGAYGMGIAVFHNGDIIYADSFGLADTEQELPCTKNTRFRAASVSKLISTVLMMKLCDDRLITLDSILDDATGLPYSTASGKVNLRHLLTHTAGITDTYLYEWGATERYSVDYVLEKSLTGIEPGTFYNYTNFGAGTMGAVIEHITGQFFHDYADRMLFEPLGMDAGYIIDLIEDKESCAVIYDHDGEVYNVPEWNRKREYYESFGLGNSYLAAQGELLITPSDLARLGTALAGDGTVKECGGKRIISEKAVEQIHEVYIDTENFGMGLNVRKYDGNLVKGRTLWGHPGNALGAITGMFYDRSDRTGIVIMTNHCNYGINDENGMYRLIDDTVNAAYDAFFS